MERSVLEKFEKLQKIIRDAGKVAVAYSGGVDSSFLLKTVVDVLGADVIAFHAKTPLLPPGESDSAETLARQIGGRFLACTLDPLQWTEFQSNPPDRCYHCKKKIYSLFFSELAKEKGYRLIDGTNSDDLLTDRPGLRAIEELGVYTPLAEAGLTKNEIRQLSYRLKLPTWDKISSSCLATRIPAGSEINSKKIELVRRCEEYLHHLGFMGCRVRLDHGDAKIELQKADIEGFTKGVNRESVTNFFTDLGIGRVFIDLVGR